MTVEATIERVVHAQQGAPTREEIQEFARQQAAIAREQAMEIQRQIMQQRAQGGGGQTAQEYARAVKQALRDGVPVPPAPPGLQVVTEGGKMTIIGDGYIEVIDGVESGPTQVGVAGGAAAQMPPFTPEVPQEAVIISLGFFAMIVLLVIGWPIARAIARRMDRKTVAAAAAPAALPPETAASIRRIEQAVDAMAIEVERISENQRFVTKLLAERPASGAELPEPRG